MVVGGKILATLVVEAVQAVLLVALASIVLGWRPGDGASLAVVAVALVLGTAAFAGLGLLLAGTLRAEATLALTNGLFLASLLIGGIVGPREPAARTTRRCRAGAARRGVGGRAANRSGLPGGRRDVAAAAPRGVGGAPCDRRRVALPLGLRARPGQASSRTWRIRSRWAGVEPQQAPMIVAPAARTSSGVVGHDGGSAR